MDTHLDEFDFEYWRDLAARDPKAFEEARARVIGSLIESAPPPARRRLQGLQWQIDRVRDRTDNPFVACFRISDMMWNTVLGDGGLIDHIEQLTGDRPPRYEPPASATVLPFARATDES